MVYLNIMRDDGGQMFHIQKQTEICCLKLNSICIIFCFLMLLKVCLETRQQKKQAYILNYDYETHKWLILHM